MLRHDTGILCAPTAFGKTVTAAALIARRGVNTLVLVHRTELLKQWQERLQAFLGVGKGVIGTIGGGKAKPTGRIDIAVMQSLSRQGETSELVENYGQVIVDECHHLSAVFVRGHPEADEGQVRAGADRHADPARRAQPIIFMQCGPTDTRPQAGRAHRQTLEVIPRYLSRNIAVPPTPAYRTCSGTLPTTPAAPTAIADEIATPSSRGARCWC